MLSSFPSFSIEERIVGGETLWVAIRARGAEWSWLTPQEAITIARAWLEKFGQAETQAREPSVQKATCPGDTR